MKAQIEHEILFIEPRIIVCQIGASNGGVISSKLCVLRQFVEMITWRHLKELPLGILKTNTYV